MLAATENNVDEVKPNLEENAGVDTSDAGIAQEDEVKEDDAEESNRPDFLNEEDSDEDDFVVTIGEIKANLPYQKHHSRAAGTVDLDGNPTLKDGTPIYDLDLAAMEDKPWRKPGADVTDYFNYGFNEETWNQYCERQRKFRNEFGTDQAAINKAILSNIQITGPAAQIGLSSYAGGRQLVNLSGGVQEVKTPQSKVQKIVVDLSKPPPMIGMGTTAGGGESNSASNPPVPLMRAVISETGMITRHDSSSDLISSAMQGENSTNIAQESMNAPTQSPMTKSPPSPLIPNSNAQPPQPLNVIDFSKPPPKFDPAIPPPVSMVNQIQVQPPAQPQPMINQAPPEPMTNIPTTRMPPMTANVDLPPGIEEFDGPPGVSQMPSALPRMDFSQPPPASQFNFPTPFAAASSALFGGSGVQLPQQQPFNARPPPLFQPSFRHPFGGGFHGRFHDRYRGTRGITRHDDRSSDSDNDSGPSHRKKRRSDSHSRSRSPSSSKRHKEDKRKEREHKEKEGKKKKDKEKEKKEKHKSHRSSSVKKEKESSSRSIKTERRSSEREKEESSSSRHRSSPRRKEKEAKPEGGIKIKIERKSPGWDE